MAEMTKQEQQMVRRELMKLNSKAWGVAMGFLAGLTLFLATVILVLKGGENVGQHLSLLSVYLPGYSVTMVGALLGFVYLFVIGYAVGSVIGYVYNWAAKPRD